ncbi:MAG: hypothetical protein QW165_01015 [Candidatus Woesearchaeota archaeon]
MKWLFFLLVLSVGVSAVVNGNDLPVNLNKIECSQWITGTTGLNPNYLQYFLEKRLILFGSEDLIFPIINAVACDATVNRHFFEVNGIFANCGPVEEGSTYFPDNPCACTLTSSLSLEGNDPNLLVHLTKEDREIILPNAWARLKVAMDCLIENYSPEDDEPVIVGSATWFNDVKPCYVSAINILGMLENIYSRTPEAFFLVQKLQELEVELMHKLALEDQKAKAAWIVLPNTCNVFPINAHTSEGILKKNIFLSPNAAMTFWNAVWGNCGGIGNSFVQSQMECFEQHKIDILNNALKVVCDPLDGEEGDIEEVFFLSPLLLGNCNNAVTDMECRCKDAFISAALNIDQCFSDGDCPGGGIDTDAASLNSINTLQSNGCLQCLERSNAHGGGTTFTGSGSSDSPTGAFAFRASGNGGAFALVLAAALLFAALLFILRKR